MEVQDYQILDQYSHEQIWCPIQLLALMPHLCVLSNQPHILCSPRWQNTPFVLTGITPDISICQPVFYATYDQNFPAESEERACYWVGFGSIVVMP